MNNTQTQQLFSGSQGGPRPLASIFESENRADGVTSSPNTSNSADNPFAQALAKTRENPTNGEFSVQSSAERSRLTNKEIPTQQPPLQDLETYQSLFDAEEIKTQQRLDATRQQLQQMIAAAPRQAQYNLQQVQVEVSKEIVNPGETGVYHTSYLSAARASITREVHAAQTWKRFQSQKKAQKRKVRQGLGAVIENKTEQAHDKLENSERNLANSGD